MVLVFSQLVVVVRSSVSVVAVQGTKSIVGIWPAVHSGLAILQIQADTMTPWIRTHGENVGLHVLESLEKAIQPVVIDSFQNQQGEMKNVSVSKWGWLNHWI